MHAKGEIYITETSLQSAQSHKGEQRDQKVLGV